MNAAVSAPSPKSRRKRLGIVNARSNASPTAPRPNANASDQSRTRPNTRLSDVRTDSSRVCATNDPSPPPAQRASAHAPRPTPSPADEASQSASHTDRPGTSAGVSSSTAL